MKQFIIAILILISGPAVFAQDATSLIHKGNELYNLQNYKDAELDYRKAAEKKDAKLQSNFNLGDALYKQKQFDVAAKNFTDIAANAPNATVKAGAYHNLGNALLEKKKYDESIAAYEKALLNNPKDNQTRYNLAYAQEMLKKQQQQNKNNKNNQNNQNKNNQNKQNQDKNNKDKKNQDKNNQNKDQNQQNKDQQNQNQPDKLSKEDAQRMLDALNDQEKNTQDKLKNKKLKGGTPHIDKDW